MLIEKKQIFLLFIPVLAILFTLFNYYPTPEPFFIDEHSHLFQAETFLSKRLSNPSDPNWKAFETFGLIQEPTWSSRYLPANGMVLALGKLISDQVIIINAILFCLLCFLITWMLSCWSINAEINFLTTAAFCLNGYIINLWVMSYMSFFPAIIGATLLIGSIPNLATRNLSQTFFGIGLVLMMLSRPFEGLLLSVITFIYLFLNSKKLMLKFSNFLLPSFILALGIIFLSFYNYATTLNPFKLAYMIYEQQYGPIEVLFYQQKLELPNYNLDYMHTYYMGEMYLASQITQSISLFTQETFRRGNVLLENYFTYPIAFIFLFFFFTKNNNLKKAILYFLLIFIFVTSLSTFFQTHYAAVYAPAILVLFALIFENAAKSKTILKYIATFLIIIGLCFSWSKGTKIFIDKQKILANKKFYQEKLFKAEGKDLVFVKNQQSLSIYPLWVFNSPNLESSEIIWANDLGTTENQKLIERFNNRKIWYLDAGNIKDINPINFK